MDKKTSIGRWQDASQAHNAI